MKISETIVTPAKATAWLANNTGNRKLQVGVVKRYAQEMLEGKWRLTHQGVAIAKSGRLMDGQHRLHAVVRANIPVLMTVAEGLDDDVFAHIDGGKSRSASDRLGEDPRLVELAKFALLLTKGDANPDVDTLRTFVEQVRAPHDYLMSVCSTVGKVISATPVRMATIVVMMEQPSGWAAIAALYRALVLRHYNDLSPAAQAFLRQVDTGRASSGNTKQRMDLLARAFVAVTPSRAAAGKVQVKDPDVARRRVQAVFKGAGA